ncbi:MAG: transcriptional regulator [Microbacterium sp. 69-7]|uniref:MarR family winged helix-turn-helix transcriptional regulator n=1 Tax=Microbacterium sp. 69-7 TaxID=1895784 RepID=UPI00025882ED|nr:MarR family transcriptional regulator [Microbacterium sp. 69-7]EIC08918.1 regulatory protein MarR [Microbacterium laevaniformans OR221]OJU42791.1 MAG: transcriptional regulator [Microbacterium sp. 69-7]
MAARLTVTLHELVGELDLFADAWLREKHGVNFNLFEILATLAERAPIDITGLAHCLRVTKAAVSKRVPTLVADGWLTATAGEGRRIILELTPKGVELVRIAGGELEAEFAQMLADPRLHPLRSGTGISPAALNAHLSALTDIVLAKGRTS